MFHVMPEIGGVIAYAEFLDPEMLMEGIRDSQLMPCQLSPRPSASWIGRLNAPRIGLDLVSLGPAMLFSGAMPKERYTLTFVVACPGDGVSYNFGIRHTDGYLGFFPPGSVLEASTPEGCVSASLTIPVEEFHAAVARYFPEIPERVLREGAGVRVGPAEQAVLRGLLRQLEEAIRSGRGGLENAALRSRVERDLLAAYFAALRSGCEAPIHGPRPRDAGRYQRIRRARDFIADRLDEAIHLEDVGMEIGLSARGTENLFKDLIGVNPVVFLRHQRLHGVRRKLLAADPGVATVKMAALETGFRHLGRFAAEYRTLFGESPRETLGRC
jgi:AraC-like DNA-binding protein